MKASKSEEAILATFLLATLCLVGLFATAPSRLPFSGPVPTQPATVRPTTIGPNVANGQFFDHIVTIVLESAGLADLCGLNIPPCNGGTTSPYLASLANNNSLALEYTSADRTTPSGCSTISDSQPNYIALTSGQIPCPMPCSAGSGCQPPTADCVPDPTTCNMGTTLNVVDRLELAGLTWRAFAEDYPAVSGCYISADTGHFVGRHFPFNYYTDITSNPSRCTNLLRANTASSGLPDTPFINYLNASSGWANYIWLTPNLCDNGHDSCPQIGNIATSCSANGGGGFTCQHEAYLKQLVPSILQTTMFTTQRSVLLMTFDEGDGFCPNGKTGGGDCVYTVFVGSGVKTQFTSLIAHTLYSYLATLEANWSFAPLTINDSSATVMSEFLTPLPPPFGGMGGGRPPLAD